MNAEEVNLIDSCCQTEVCSVFGSILVVLGCLFAPLDRWWIGLGPKTRGLILVGLSTIVGTLDTCFDWMGITNCEIHGQKKFVMKTKGEPTVFFGYHAAR